MRSDRETIRERFGAKVSDAARRAGYDIDGHGGKAQLARDTGIPESSVGRMLAGKTMLDPKYFAPLAKAVNLDPVDLFVEAELLPPDSVTDVWSQDRTTRVLVARIEEMSPEDRAEFAEIAEIYARRRKDRTNSTPE